jgi:hypothetical protein
MAEKKTKRVKNILPQVILVFVLLSTILIIVDVSGHLIENGLIGTELAPTISEPTDLPGTETPARPTPTAEPVQGA